MAKTAVGGCVHPTRADQAAFKIELKEGAYSSEAFHDLLEAQLWVRAQDLVRDGQSVIFEKGLWLRCERDEKRPDFRLRHADEQFAV